MAGPWEAYQERGPWESYKDTPFEIPKTVFRKKIERQEDPVINAEMGKEEGRPPWVKFADFLTGHFPDNSQVKPEVQTVDGKLQINVPETAEVPFLQSPEMAIGAGAAAAVKATGGIAAKVIKGVEEAAGYATGGITDIAKATTKGVKKVAENVVSPESLEAMVKGGKVSTLPKYAEGSSINLERMDTTQDVLQLQNALAKAAEEEIGKRRIPWKETVKAAEELAWDSKEFLKQANKKGGFSAAEIHAARQINSNALHDLFNTVKDMPADAAQRTDAMRFGVMDKINNYVEIMKATSRKSSEAGRALNIHKKMITDNPEFAQDALRLKTLQAMLDQNGGRKAIDGMIDDLAKVDFKDPAAVREILQKYHKATAFDMFYEAWMNGILSAPPTHFANIIGNTLTMATKVPESAISSVLRGKSPLGEIKAETFGMLQGLKDGIRLGLKTFQTGVPSDLFSKIETRHMNAIPGKLGEVIRIPTRSLTAADEFFKAIVYRAEMNRQAYLAAEKTGLKGRALGEKMSEILNDPYHKSFKAINDKAKEESLYRTFNKPLGEFGNSVMRLRDKVPALRYIMPFIRTPVNIAKFAFERTPFNFGKIAFDYKAGKIAKEQLSQELAKPIMGSLISAATVMAVLEGHITGMAPKNKKERDLLYAKGWQPYSIKVGSQYYSYNRLEPIGSIMGMAADFIDSARSESEINEKAGRMMLSVSRNLASKTFLQGVSNTLDAISDPERYGATWTERFAGSLIPSVVGRAAAAYDPYAREVETPWEAIQARTPYYSTKLPYKVGANIRGMELPIERQGTPMQRFLSPITVTEEAKEPMKSVIDAELESHRLTQMLNKTKSKAKKEALREHRTSR